MTIADALRCVAPPAAAATEEEREVRQTAFACLYDELHALARRICGPTADAEDIASAIACRLAETGPREPETSPATDDAARVYLAMAVRNRQIDRHRAGKRHVGDERLERVAAHSSPAMSGMAAQLLQDAERLLYEEAVPAIARECEGRFDREAFVATIAQMRAIHRETLTVDAVLEADGGVTAAGRNRLYKQHERARRRLLTQLPRWLEERGLAAGLDAAIRTLAAAELSARVTRGGP